MHLAIFAGVEQERLGSFVFANVFDLRDVELMVASLVDSMGASTGDAAAHRGAAEAASRLRGRMPSRR